MTGKRREIHFSTHFMSDVIWSKGWQAAVCTASAVNSGGDGVGWMTPSWVLYCHKAKSMRWCPTHKRNVHMDLPLQLWKATAHLGLWGSALLQFESSMADCPSRDIQVSDYIGGETWERETWAWASPSLHTCKLSSFGDLLTVHLAENLKSR